jgi:hypothetical protein
VKRNNGLISCFGDGMRGIHSGFRYGGKLRMPDIALRIWASSKIATPAFSNFMSVVIEIPISLHRLALVRFGCLIIFITKTVTFEKPIRKRRELV